MPMLLFSSAFRRIERYGPLTYLDAIQGVKPFLNSVWPDHMSLSHIKIVTGLSDNFEEAVLSFHLCVGSGGQSQVGKHVSACGKCLFLHWAIWPQFLLCFFFLFLLYSYCTTNVINGVLVVVL